MSYGGGGIPFPGGSQPRDRYVNPYAGYGAPPAQYGDPMGMMPSMPPAATARGDPYANPKPGTIAYAKFDGPDGEEYTPVIAKETTYNTATGPVRGIQWVTATANEVAAAGLPPPTTGLPPPTAQYPQSARMPAAALPHSGAYPGIQSSPNPSSRYLDDPEDDYPVMRPGMTEREYEKEVKRWEKYREKERRAGEKAVRRAEKEKRKQERERERDWDRDPQDPYDITGGRSERPRRMSAGAPLGFERTRRMSGGGMLREEELTRKLESLDTSFNTRRERRMSGAGYGPNAGGFRSRKNSIGEVIRDRELSDEYGQSTRPSFYPPSGAGVPGGGGYGAPMPGGYGAGARSMPGSPVRPHSAFAPSTYNHDDAPRDGPSPRPGYYSRSRHASPARGPTQLPGGYGGSTYGGPQDPASSSAYRSYGAERTRY